MKLKYLSNLASVVDFLKKSVEAALLEDIAERGVTSLILPGGETIRPFLPELSLLSVEWSKIHCILTDERWVPSDHKESNESQLNRLFVRNLSNIRYISLKTKHRKPESSFSEIRQRLAILTRPVCCVILSVGSDGHIASLFEREYILWKKRDIVATFHNSMPRISLGFPLLGYAKNLFILASNKKRLNYFLNSTFCELIENNGSNSTILCWES